MKHHIDPKIDCVFKALLGSEENSNLLIHFLNTFLAKELTTPITSVEILNPYNEKEFVSDKLSIVDIKAKDEQKQVYQVEIQLQNHDALLKRIIYDWADIYSQQLKSGEPYHLLKPTYSIWLLAENLLKTDQQYWHCYKLRDEQSQVITEHGGIWLLELAKFKIDKVKTDEQRWLKFFKDGEALDDAALPDWMNTNEMRQAMTTLSRFSEKEREYFQYQARQEYLRVQYALEKGREDAIKGMEDAIQRAQQAEQEKQQAEREKQQAEREKQQAEREKQQAEQEKQQAEQEKQQALLEVERLKALLANRL